ncbi:MAG: hypothetical protein ACLTX3_08110 [Lachnospiraceae bacterium]
MKQTKILLHNQAKADADRSAASAVKDQQTVVDQTTADMNAKKSALEAAQKALAQARVDKAQADVDAQQKLVDAAQADYDANSKSAGRSELCFKYKNFRKRCRKRKKWLLWKKESKMPRKDRMRSLLRSRIHKVEWGLWTVNTGPQKGELDQANTALIQQKRRSNRKRRQGQIRYNHQRKTESPGRCKKPWIPLINLQWKPLEQKDSLTA